MKGKVTCFIPGSDNESLKITTDSLLSSGMTGRIIILASDGRAGDNELKGTETMVTDSLYSTSTVKLMSQAADTEYLLTYSKAFPLDLGKHALERMVQVADATGAGMVYSDYYERKGDTLAQHPVTDYQEGSLRDDFNFGSVILWRAEAVARAAGSMNGDYRYAGFYDLRLKVSKDYPLFHIQEYLYSEVETDLRKSGEKQFDYVDPRNRALQVEMELACTEHLKVTGAWLPPEFTNIDFNDKGFEYDASVIIPVRNRVKTIGDAINSVLNQKTAYNFNLIIVDNFSTDGTTEIIAKIAGTDPRVVHIIPDRRDLGIGGCWNEGLFSKKCGRFAIQLDSDDLYIDDNVVDKIINQFHEQNCAMLVGSYRMVNFELKEIPPGLIDHREWTPDNGRNNALRINGLGAPRAFYTPVLREITVPNVSYGEDYAVGLAISRNYRIGRIYEPLYLCRRWDDNSDASLDVTRTNVHNYFKDKIRTIELIARKRMIAGRTGNVNVL